MSSTDKIIDRIRKLLALAQGRSNENEAAAAAAQAAALMATHNLEAAQLEIDTGVAAQIQLDDVVIDDSSQRRTPWKAALADSAARLNGARCYTSSGSVHVFGTPSAIQTVTYTYTYLCSEVNRLADEHWIESAQQFYGTTMRRWKNSFKLGAAYRIATRLIETQKERDLADAKEAANGNQALVLVRNHAALVQASYEAFKKSNGIRAASGGTSSSRAGFAAGIAAGNTVHLGGNQKALGSGPRQLR